MKKLRSVFLYLIFAVICLVIIYPVFLVVILPFQDSDELRQTLSPLTMFMGEYVDVDYIPQYPTLNHFKKSFFCLPQNFTEFFGIHCL